MKVNEVIDKEANSFESFIKEVESLIVKHNIESITMMTSFHYLNKHTILINPFIDDDRYRHHMNNLHDLFSAKQFKQH